MMEWIIDGVRTSVREGTSLLEALEKSKPAAEVRNALGARIGGRVIGLDEQPEPGAAVQLLTYKSEAGRRIYERSILFLYLTAARDCFPGMRIQIEYAIGTGLVTHTARNLTPADVARIEQRMRALVKLDLPLDRVRLTLSEAADYFRRDEQTDKVRLLAYRPYDHFDLYRSNGMMQYFYGPMVPRLGWLPTFALRKEQQGVLLLQPDIDQPDRVAPWKPLPHLSEVYGQSQEWCEILGCVNVADLNDVSQNGEIRQLVRINEALHEKKVAEIAAEIAKKPGRVVLISGPSCSGKTTFSHRLEVQLRVFGLRPVRLSLDDYYRNRDSENIPKTPEGNPDLEHIDALDVSLFQTHLQQLLRGERTHIPTFDFQTQKRAPNGTWMQLSSEQPIIVEGIHGLNPALTSALDAGQKYAIYVSSLPPLNLDDHNRIRSTDSRLLRRLVRDMATRNTPPENTLAIWPDVRAGENRWIFPYQEKADVMFNTSLLYELAVLKPLATPLLKSITPDSPHFAEADRLAKFLHYVLPADVLDEIPPTSLLREFVGGCTFYR